MVSIKMKIWLPWALKIGLSAGLIAWVLSEVDFSEVWNQAAGMDPMILAAALGLLLVHMVVGTARWMMVLQGLALHFGALKGFAVYYIGAFFSTVLPGPVAGDAVRVWYSYKAGLPLRSALNSVLLDRAVTLYALVALVCATQPQLHDRVPDLPGMMFFTAVLAACTLGIAVLAVLDQVPLPARQSRIIQELTMLAADVRAFFFRSVWSPTALVTAVAAHVNLALIVYLLALGMGLDVDVTDCLVLVPPVILITAIPISVAGWGVRETAMVTAFGFIGIAPEASLALSVMFGILLTIASLPGGLVFLAFKGQVETRIHPGLKSSSPSYS